MRREIILLFSVLLCSQTFKSLESRAVSQEVNEEITDRDLLFMYGIIQFQNMASPTVHDFRRLFIRVLNEAEAGEPVGEHVELILAKISKFQAEMDLLDNIRSSGERSAKLLEVFADLVHLLTDVASALNAPRTDEDRRLNAILERNGLIKNVESLQRRFDRFKRNISKKVGEYINRLTEQQKLEQREVVEWKTTFDATIPLDELIGVFTDFLLMIN